MLPSVLLQWLSSCVQGGTLPGLPDTLRTAGHQTSGTPVAALTWRRTLQIVSTTPLPLQCALSWIRKCFSSSNKIKPYLFQDTSTVKACHRLHMHHALVSTVSVTPLICILITSCTRNMHVHPCLAPVRGLVLCPDPTHKYTASILSMVCCSCSIQAAMAPLRPRAPSPSPKSAVVRTLYQTYGLYLWTRYATTFHMTFLSVAHHVRTYVLFENRASIQS